MGMLVNAWTPPAAGGSEDEESQGQTLEDMHETANPLQPHRDPWVHPPDEYAS